MLTRLEHLIRDLRFGARTLAGTPGSSALAIVSLALGIMAATAIYSVVHAVILDPFPYRDVDRLMSVRVSNAAQRGFRTGYSVDQFLEIADRSRIFDGVIASTITDVLWTGQGDPQRLRGNYGTFNTFDVMGVPPLLGRTPGPDDARPGATPVVVLGYRFWQRQFSGDPQVLGMQLRLNDVVRTVIGVMPKRFMWRGADVYLPITFERGRFVEDVRGVHLLGRLKPGVTDAQAEADLTPIVADLKKREPAEFPDQWRVGLLSFKDTFPSGITGDLWVLFGAVALLFLISCANVSNLLLSRATGRQQEMAVRVALGASRGRLVRQLLAESLLLAAVAGAIGTALAYAGLPAILALVPPGTIPDESEITLNGPVLVFTLLVAGLASVLCGLAPALQSYRADVASSIRESARGLSGGSRQAILRKALVVFEVALSLMLLAGCSLLVRTFAAKQAVRLDVPADQVLTLRVPLPPRRYPDAARRIAFFEALLPRIGALPGVAAAGLNTGAHPLGNVWTTVAVPGAPASTEPVVVHQISAGYPDAVGIRLAAGRMLSEGDVRGTLAVALVNDRFVRTRLEGRPPLGQLVHLPRLKQPPFNVKDDGFQVVGVVHDAPNNGLAEPVMPEVYVPYTAAGIANRVLVRAQGSAAGISRAVIAQVYAIDREQPVDQVKPLDIVLAENEYATPRFNLALFLVFAILGLSLAVVGVYGVMSNAVAQQTHEIGVRMALGAGAGTVIRMVVARGARLLLLGVGIGLAGSAAAARFLAGQIWNVSALDPVAFGVVSLILLAAGLLACAWPARRAGRIDPIIALRTG